MDIEALPHKRNLLLQRETLMIVGVVSALLLAAISSFLFLWGNFRIGFVWIISFMLIFASRYFYLWKVGVECFYLLTFMFSYIFGLWVALPLVYISFALVAKILPHELNSVLSHGTAITFVAFASRILLNSYGLSLAPAEFVLVALVAIFPGIAFDFLLAWKIAPVSLFKNFMNHAMDYIVNYFMITSFGFALFTFFLTMA